MKKRKWITLLTPYYFKHKNKVNRKHHELHRIGLLRMSNGTNLKSCAREIIDIYKNSAKRRLNREPYYFVLRECILYNLILLCRFVNKNNYTIKDNPKSKMRKHKELSKFHSNNQQENGMNVFIFLDQSFISYTETKLDGIYSNTIQLQKDIMKLDKINLQGGKNETEVQDQIN